MTIDERIQLAMSGLRLRTDELGRPPSHDEVEAMLRKLMGEIEIAAMESVHSLDGEGTVRHQLEHLAVEISYDLKRRYEKLPGLKSMTFEFAFEGQLYSYGFSGPGYSEEVKARQRTEAVAQLRDAEP